MKKLFCALMVAACAGAASAEWLLWQVVESDFADVKGLDVGDVVAARVGYVTAGQNASWSGTALANNWSSGNENMGDMVGIQETGDKDNFAFSAKINLSDIASPASYSYYIELLNESSEVIARTEAGSGNTYATYASLSNYRATGDIGSVPQAAIWHGGTFEAVPEPSSMALLALGAGLVGLRRKLKKGRKAKKETCA